MSALQFIGAALIGMGLCVAAIAAAIYWFTGEINDDDPWIRSE